MGFLIKSKFAQFTLVALVVLSIIGVCMFFIYFYEGGRSDELRSQYEEVLKISDPLQFTAALNEIIIKAKTHKDKSLFIESSLLYYASRSSYGFKMESYQGLINLLYSHYDFISKEQFFHIYSLLLSTNVESYYLRDKLQSQKSEFIKDELNKIVNSVKDKSLKSYYLTILYGLNLNRTANELDSLEKEILRLSDDPEHARKTINYRKAVRCRANKDYAEELKYMRMASAGGEPGIGELGVTYRNNNLLDSAEILLLKTFKPDSNKILVYHLYPSINLAKLYIKKRDFDKAKYYLNQAINVANKYAGEFYYNEIQEIKSDYYIKNGDYNLAVNELQKEKSDIIQQFGQYFKTSRESSIIIIEVKSLKRKRNIIVFTFSVVLSGIAVLGILFVQYQLKKYKVLWTEKELEKEKSEIIQQDLNKAFSHFSEQTIISEKREHLLDILVSKEQIKNLLSSREKALIDDLRKNSSKQNEWNLVKKNFNVHFPDFYSKLLKINPGLTEMELKYATYIKLSLSNHEIANLLHVNVQSVATFKYRLKQRLGLEKDQSLLGFIINL